jgi:hypothetical protein
MFQTVDLDRPKDPGEEDKAPDHDRPQSTKDDRESDCERDQENR